MPLLYTAPTQCSGCRCHLFLRTGSWPWLLLISGIACHPPPPSASDSGVHSYPHYSLELRELRVYMSCTNSHLITSEVLLSTDLGKWNAGFVASQQSPLPPQPPSPLFLSLAPNGQVPVNTFAVALPLSLPALSSCQGSSTGDTPTLVPHVSVRHIPSTNI